MVCEATIAIVKLNREGFIACDISNSFLKNGLNFTWEEMGFGNTRCRYKEAGNSRCSGG